MSDVFDEIRALLRAEPTPWRPEPGDELVGTVRSFSRRSTEQSKGYPCLTIAPAGGGAWLDVHAWHKVLWDEIETQGPRVGDAIGIRYGGNPDGRYERWRLVVVPVWAPRVEASAAPSPRDPGGSRGDHAGEVVEASTDHDPRTPAAEDSGTRVVRWSQLLERATDEDMTPAQILAIANSPKPFTATSAPLASLLELENALRWLDHRPSIGVPA